MTSNIGARQLKEFGQGVGFTTSAKAEQADLHAKSVIENALKKAFAPEFLNRIDDIIMFNHLKREDIHKIIDIELEKLFARINTIGYEVKITDEAKDFIASKGFDENFGARHLNRAIQKNIEDPLAEQIINSNIQEGDTILIDLDKEKQEILIKTQKPSNKKKKKTEEE
jgi:ATP-dependent Clp protease ATP-binding subunit ClpC